MILRLAVGHNCGKRREITRGRCDLQTLSEAQIEKSHHNHN